MLLVGERSLVPAVVRSLVVTERLYMLPRMGKRVTQAGGEASMGYTAKGHVASCGCIWGNYLGFILGGKNTPLVLGGLWRLLKHRNRDNQLRSR
jgi:hypothetical protein